MGASPSGLSESQLKRVAGEREIEGAVQVHFTQEERGDVALRDNAADRIRCKYPDREPGEVLRLASSLSKSSSLQEAFFSGMSDASTEDLPLAITWRDIGSPETRKTLQQAFDKFAPQFQYGSYCATIKIGSMYLTWDNSELVIPETDINPIFEDTPTREVAEVVTPTSLSPEDVQISTVFKEDLVVDMRQNKTERIGALLDVLVRYNTKYHFGLLTCNCQHFVGDILEALGAKENVRCFEDCLSHHRHVLEYRGVDVVKEEFNTHQELDTYVNIRLENMDAGELYFCYGHYLLFHAWSKECPQLSAFKCPMISCRFRELTYRV